MITPSNIDRQYLPFCLLILFCRGVRGVAFAVIVVATTVRVLVVVRAITVRSLVRDRNK